MRPPLVLIHDAGGDHLSWPAEMRLLPRTRVYTLDLPGHGKTSGLGRQYMEDYARCIVEFMHAAGLPRAVFGGHGMGGAIGLTLALDHPEWVAGLIAISSGPRLPVPAVVLENGANASTLPQAINILLGMSYHAGSSAHLREAAGRRLMQMRQTLLFGDWLACNRFDVTGRIQSIRTPMLVICGTSDRLTPLHLSEILAGQIPGAALQTVDEAGHMAILEQPKQIAKLISVFMNTIAYTPGL